MNFIFNAFSCAKYFVDTSIYFLHTGSQWDTPVENTIDISIRKGEKLICFYWNIYGTFHRDSFSQPTAESNHPLIKTLDISIEKGEKLSDFDWKIYGNFAAGNSIVIEWALPSASSRWQRATVDVYWLWKFTIDTSIESTGFHLF